jgi:hypothetical protein
VGKFSKFNKIQLKKPPNFNFQEVYTSPMDIILAKTYHFVKSARVLEGLDSCLYGEMLKISRQNKSMPC